VNATKVIYATADWQAGTSRFQADAEIQKKISVLIDTLPESARGEFEDFLTSKILDAKATIPETEQWVPDTLIEYLPEILELARWLSTFT
jgi:hypothetical protein